MVARDRVAVDAALLRHDVVPLDAEAEGGAAHRVRACDVCLEVVPEVAGQVRLHTTAAHLTLLSRSWATAEGHAFLRRPLYYAV